MIWDSLWVTGSSRSGKTARLVKEFCNWVLSETSSKESYYTKNKGEKNSENIPRRLYLHQTEPGVLILAANDENRRDLADRIVRATAGKYPVRCKTPLGFIQDEVTLFWPLLIQLLKLKAQFPVRLRPETEQELATKLWRPQLDEETLRRAGDPEYRLVRRILDLLQLGAYSGIACEKIDDVLLSAIAQQENSTNLEPELIISLLLNWRNWCLDRGFLTYGIMTEVYGKDLLPNPIYQQQLTKRYQAVLADDIQDYPALSRHLFELLLNSGAVGAFSYNPDSVVRLGLGADPNYLEGLSAHCRQEILTQPPFLSIGEASTIPMLELITEQIIPLSLPAAVQSIQTISRAQLLRQTAEVIVKAVKDRHIQPNEVAIIAPGLDAIARYTLTEILTKQNIQVQPLNDQRPLISSPIIRGLLTVLALVYPGLGRLVDRDAVAEMLVVLSRGVSVIRGEKEKEQNPHSLVSSSPSFPHIDPVRAGLIADYCFVPHPEEPKLLPVTAFDRWDRLGYAATTAYGNILQWLENQKTQQELRLIPTPISLLDRAIQRFLWNGNNLPYDQLAALRELLETAQHYWEIDTRLQRTPFVSPPLKEETQGSGTSPHSTIGEFIQLLRRGTITANPYPVHPIGPKSNAVALATIFQYRSSRRSHRWQFWLDTGSPLWAKGGAATLFGAPFFLQERLGEPWTVEDEKSAEEQRLRTILADLLARVSQRVYLCHSDLAVNGQEQLGPLLPLVHACVSVVSDPAVV
ncbi:recombinase family protein [Brasilonema bromeliae]|uniref:Recombinase family protein n=1 Tax=Brasilonema bromeliae SPC951 TaxID=385972 RepID=A0ABX1P8D3_9CYAN|nr:recombinase family protein [Brasilonema bromeliae]NMG20238.1 recombinase family protein [Brasilonema bromeliae SPC951]